MQKMALVIALKKTILGGVPIGQFQKEYRALSDKDKQDLADLFNKEKPLGADVEVKVKLS